MEQFCVYASHGTKNIKQLLSLNVMRQAAKTIHQTVPQSSQIKALNLCGYLLSEDYDKRAIGHIEEANAVPNIVKFLDSPN